VLYYVDDALLDEMQPDRPLPFRQHVVAWREDMRLELCETDRDYVRD
jgi:hypothetical protein